MTLRVYGVSVAFLCGSTEFYFSTDILSELNFMMMMMIETLR